ncbi:hypothetical protein [Nocardia sp. NPDC052316]|uniref:hypothetical protein n=1 Tax=Nocardia sp. NPDC052316 TaxID=3364329 RepID=UPI0037C9ED3B
MVTTSAVLIGGVGVVAVDPLTPRAEAGPNIPCEQWQQMHPGWPCVDVPDPPTPPPGPPTTPSPLPTPAIPGQPQGGTGGGSQAGALTPPPLAPGNGTPIVPVPGDLPPMPPAGSSAPPPDRTPLTVEPSVPGLDIETPSPARVPAAAPSAKESESAFDYFELALRQAAARDGLQPVGLFDDCDWRCMLRNGTQVMKCVGAAGVLLIPLLRFARITKILEEVAARLPRLAQRIASILEDLEKGKDRSPEKVWKLLKELAKDPSFWDVFWSITGLGLALSMCLPLFGIDLGPGNSGGSGGGSGNNGGNSGGSGNNGGGTNGQGGENGTPPPTQAQPTQPPMTPQAPPTPEPIQTPQNPPPPAPAPPPSGGRCTPWPACAA